MQYKLRVNGTPQNRDTIQSAFIDEQVAQCVYCTNGTADRVKAAFAKV